MALTFRTPPNWPQQPKGWTPDSNWQPDPEWGPAPDGWQFWVDETQPETSTTAEKAAAETVAPASSKTQDNSDQDSDLPVSAAIAAALGSAAPAKAAETEEASPQSRSQVRQQNRSKVKKRAAVLAGVSTLALLAIGGALVLGSQTNETDKASATASATSETSLESTSINATGASATSPTLELATGTEKPVVSDMMNTYSGSGEEVFDMIIPGGGGAYYTYSFTGDTENSKLQIQGMDERNFENDWGTESIGAELKGSGVIDASGTTKSFKIRANGEGTWDISMLPIEATPVYAKGEAIRGSSSAAFYYEGPATTAEVVFIPAEGSNSANFTLQAGVDVDPTADPLIETSKPTLKTVDLGQGKALLAVHSNGGEWSVSFK